MKSHQVLKSEYLYLISVAVCHSEESLGRSVNFRLKPSMAMKQASSLSVSLVMRICVNLSLSKRVRIVILGKAKEFADRQNRATPMQR